MVDQPIKGDIWLVCQERGFDIGPIKKGYLISSVKEEGYAINLSMREVCDQFKGRVISLSKKRT
jgi:hypothetical protein